MIRSGTIKRYTADNLARIPMMSPNEMDQFPKETPLRSGREHSQLPDCACPRMVYPRWYDPDSRILCRAINAGRAARNSHGCEWWLCHA